MYIIIVYLNSSVNYDWDGSRMDFKSFRKYEEFWFVFLEKFIVLFLVDLIEEEYGVKLFI